MSRDFGSGAPPMVWTCFGVTSLGFRSVQLSTATGDLECASQNGITCTSFTTLSQCLSQTQSLVTIPCPMYMRAGTNVNCTQASVVGATSSASLYQCQNSDRLTPAIAALRVDGQEAYQCFIETPSKCAYVTTTQSCLGLFMSTSIKPAPIALPCKPLDLSQPLPEFCLSTGAASPSNRPSTVVPAPTYAASTSTFPPQMEQAPSTTDTSSSSSSSSTTVTVAVAIPLAVVAIAVGVFIYLKRSRRQKKTPETEAPPYTKHIDDDVTLDASVVDLSALVGCRIPSQDIVKGKLIGKGGFGQVYRGTCLGQVVAIKEIVARRQQHTADVQSFVREMTLLARLDSPYIVAFLGVAWTSDAAADFQCVLEYMNNGDLRDYLKAHTADTFPWAAKLKCVEAIVQGLVYLHSQGVIHRDLKTRNVLLDKVKGTKLSDFGLSRTAMASDTMTMGVGTYRYMAPEVLQSSHYSAKADLYSLGMVLSELDTLQAPFHDVRNANGQPVTDAVLINIIVNHTAPIRFSNTMPKWLVGFAHLCLQRNPDLRPSASDLLDAILDENNTARPSPTHL
ncbi:hypothetical protein DYB32_004424 [Aphanomyces invadans]|uniref:Protein kinase domain-containing protein n=1 Tax=Aphanomyces invadans TaxID=157072 RepID=A0A418AXN2_9STRA|nr:hypothetical protein DYB32_004424 [Aphanomyces invadans]